MYEKLHHRIYSCNLTVKQEFKADRMAVHIALDQVLPIAIVDAKENSSSKLSSQTVSDS